MRRRLELFNAIVLSRLKYGVASAWLSTSDLRRLDGFHASCLRSMLRIAPAYFSRVSNNTVREKVKQPPLSATIRALQLQLLGQVITNPDKHVLKEVAFHGELLVPTTAAFVRRVGRPRQNWTEQLVGLVKQSVGSLTLHRWTQVTSSQTEWDKAVSDMLVAK